jgi:iron complex outermembrane receptor protein
MMPTYTHTRIAGTLLLAACASLAIAQNTSAKPAPAPTKTTVLPKPTETMVVLGSAVPVPLAESSAAVTVLPVAGQTLTVQTFQDLLRGDASIFLQQRGAGGAQADLTLRGGNFEQALVLINGFRVNDSQSAHHNLDLPIPLEAMDSIQVLHGAGSTLHGADALSGVADFLTAAPAHDELRLRSGMGSMGGNEESLLGALLHQQGSTRLTASRDFSTGFVAVPGANPVCDASQLYRDCQNDRDYRNEDASLEDWQGSRLGMTDLLVAASDRSYGANRFYGAYNSWERTKGWFASARQEIGPRTVAAFGYRRHTDDFVLLRNLPGIYENNHIDESWQASLRRTIPVAHSSLLLAGLESDGDSIDSYNFSGGVRSNALGVHARNRGAGYLDLDLRPAKSRWNLSAGVREELFSGGLQSAFAPHLAGSLRLTSALKLRAGGGYGFRLPTYTDLYYSDPATKGNANLKPETAWSGEAGADWSATAKLFVSVTGFYNRQHETIDYVKAASLPNPLLPAGCPVNTWCAANLSGLRFAGVESSLTWIPAKNQKVQAGWTQLYSAQAPMPGLVSEYALNYPVANLHASWSAALPHAVTVTNSVAVAKPFQQAGQAPWNAQAYPVWNAAIAREAGRIRPYLRLSNLANTGYQEIAGVAMPGRTIAGGVSIWLSR